MYVRADAAAPSNPATPPLVVQLEVLFRHRYGEFVALAATIVRSRSIAEEVVQDAFASVIALGRPIDDETKLGGYVARAVVNGARSRLRRSEVETRPRAVDLSAVPGTDTASTRATELLDAVVRLPQRQAQCVVCRYLLDMTFPEIASTLGISQPTAKTHVRRGVAQLAVWVKEHP